MTIKGPTRVRIRSGETVFVILRSEYEAKLAAAGAPELPMIRGRGEHPAVDYLRISISRELMRRRIHADLSQSALAKRAGVSRATIVRTETGRHLPSEHFLRKIERALHSPMQ